MDIEAMLSLSAPIPHGDVFGLCIRTCVAGLFYLDTETYQVGSRNHCILHPSIYLSTQLAYPLTHPSTLLHGHPVSICAHRPTPSSTTSTALLMAILCLSAHATSTRPGCACVSRTRSARRSSTSRPWSMGEW